MVSSMARMISKAKNSSVTRATTSAPSSDASAYCRDLDNWPRSWMGLERDVPPGEQLLACFRPFIAHLAASSAPSTRPAANSTASSLNPALIPQVTHRFPGRGAYSEALRLLRWVAERQLVDVDALGVDPHSQNSIASVRDVSAAVGCNSEVDAQRLRL